MRVLGLEITKAQTLSSVDDRASARGWFRILESFPGAWQRNVEVNQFEITSHYAVFACMTLIAGDISKLSSPIFKRKVGDIWKDGTSASYDPVLRRPNQFQTPNQFWENWVLSKLWKGNTYILKRRDNRRVVTDMWVLDPCKVTPLISESGEVFYQLQQDNISAIRQAIVVPASEIIHDRMNAIWHPLCGISPLYAAGLAAQMGLNIQNESARFFENRSIPGGILTTPHTIPDTTAARLKEEWEKAGADMTGKTRVLGDGLEFKPMAVTAIDAQMNEQLKFTAEAVCSVFHVPPYKIGVGAMPSYNNVQALNLEYYSQAIQKQLEDIEACLLEGLEMKPGIKVEFDTDCLLRMDTVSLVASMKDAVGAGIMAPNEARSKLDLEPVEGGATPYLQQQNYSLSALNKRDTQEDPFASKAPSALPAPNEDQDDDGDDDGDSETQSRDIAADLLQRANEHRRAA
jgi:HK97 family phage portal protein